MDPIVITGAARTPMGGFQGDLAGVPAATLGATSIRAALAGLDPQAVDEVLMGCVLPAGQARRPRVRRRWGPACRWGPGRPRSTRCAARG